MNKYVVLLRTKRGRSMIKYNKAFTLAEVLITLGIIGIVASMTMPTLIGKYRNQERSARIKKFYSSLQQAILLSENDNGPIEYWTKGEKDLVNDDGDRDLEGNTKTAEAFFNKYLKNYLKHLKSGKPDFDYEGSVDYKIWFTDGSTGLLHNGSCIDIVLDVNGNKLPNKRAYDQFPFLICAGNDNADQAANRMCGNKRICAYNADINTYNTREKVLNLCKQDSKRSNCTYLLQLDNWEFKNDYPYKY